MTIYLEHFGLKEAPFKITPHTEFFFAGANRGETLEALIYAITSGEGIVKVTGEVGAGKTMLCRVLMERLPETVETIYMAVPSLTRDEMLAVIGGELGVEVPGGKTTKLIRGLQQRLIEIHGQGRQVVALIDEAHAMPLETLEEVRLLSNLETSRHKLLQMVLFGQPELDQHLLLPNMRQLRERITHSFNLQPLPAHDIKDYLDFRLRAAGYKGPDLFSRDALKLITEASEGLTRRINIYADKTLLAAYAAGTYNVTADHVRAAIADTRMNLPEQGRPKAVWLAVAASLVTGGVIGFLAARFTGGSSPPIAGNTVVSTDALAASKASPTAQVPAAPATSVAPAPAASVRPAEPAKEPLKDTAPQKVMTGPVAEPASKMTSPPVQPAVTRKEAITVTTSTSAVPEVAAAVEAVARPNMAQPAGKMDWLETRMAADRARLGGLSSERYAIQLMTAKQQEKSAIAAFLREASREFDANDIIVYPSGTPDNPRVSVVYGNFEDRDAAAAELGKLPARLVQFKPYARSFGAIRGNLRPAV
jgi:type II secretory pathway predicted ATPase ExeA/septal ring-binding cell division protein DamX